MATQSVDKKSSAKSAQLISSKDQIKSVYIDDFFSADLRHKIKLEVLLPPWYEETPQFEFPVLYVNDGQLLKQLNFKQALMDCYTRNSIPPLIIVGVHAHNRMQEYGVAGVPDYKKRGAKADKYSRFFVNELMPLVKKNFRVLEGPAYNAIAGFSLGGLSAFDIAWNYPLAIGSAGIFSGSFWWRSKGFGKDYDDSDRIMHRLVRGTDSKSNQRFWFECGTNDEVSDRNHNGVIDSIDDTLDLIHDLEEIGYVKDRDIKYVEVQGGEHNEATWAAVMPQFLEWTFGK